MKRLLSGLAALAVALPLTLTLTATPAQADGSCTFYPPTRIAVGSPYREIPVRWGADCTGDWGWWQAFHPTQGGQISMATDDGSTFDMYDFLDRGVWSWHPEGAYDEADFSSVTQNQPSTDVRLATSAYMTISRSGSAVSVYTRTSRYSPYYSTWIGFKPSPLAYLQHRSATGSWANKKALYPDSAGVYRYKFTASNAMYYRVRILDSRAGAGVWGTTSPQQYK